MKNLFLFALLLSTIATSAFATGESKINAVVLHNFKFDFKNATNVSWSSKTEYAKAAFKLNNRDMEVFYNEKGDIVGQSEHIILDELPVKAKRTFAKKYGDYTVKEAIKFIAADEESYYISAENSEENVIVEVNAVTENLSIFKKTKK